MFNIVFDINFTISSLAKCAKVSTDVDPMVISLFKVNVDGSFKKNNF